ncbi:hypothetical protein BEN74_10365 [Acinetobacter sp. WCHAc010034]|uniref:hypothetical protein n=1 Tax=Acinetobacter sp. WCHAc010034 TaxID=1879049 RepID=UPI00083AAB35|nr:hypothetical protein [Acinetobacter sp. WCHAc010034]AYA03194.1 hypothetical protein BEN74_10365 [Acinetobacter sp. WCHAc010034]
MYYLIYPDDPTIYFMNPIIKKLKSYIENGSLVLISCEADLNSYKDSVSKIRKIPENSKVIFIGHSTTSILYGGQSTDFQKRPLLELSQMSIFKNIELFLISCFSEKLLKSSRSQRNYSKCLGFGLLPSELQEVVAHSSMRKLALDQDDINIFKFHLADIFCSVLNYMISNNTSLDEAYNYFKIITHKKTNELILVDKNEKVAELFFYVSQEALLD